MVSLCWLRQRDCPSAVNTGVCQIRWLVEVWEAGKETLLCLIYRRGTDGLGNHISRLEGDNLVLGNCQPPQARLYIWTKYKSTAGSG